MLLITLVGSLSCLLVVFIFVIERTTSTKSGSNEAFTTGYSSGSGDVILAIIGVSISIGVIFYLHTLSKVSTKNRHLVQASSARVAHFVR